MSENEIIKELQRVTDGIDTLDSPFLDVPLYTEYIKGAINIITEQADKIKKLEAQLDQRCDSCIEKDIAKGVDLLADKIKNKFAFDYTIVDYVNEKAKEIKEKANAKKI